MAKLPEQPPVSQIPVPHGRSHVPVADTVIPYRTKPRLGGETKKILYVSDSIGLGHIQRDLAIANALRDEYPNIDIVWLAAHPATEVLERASETLVPEAAQWVNPSAVAEQVSSGTNFNLMNYLLRSPSAWLRSVQLMIKLANRDQYDLVIGDETYELVIALELRRRLLPCPLTVLYDFLGIDSMTANPFEHAGAEFINWIWSEDSRLARHGDLILFVGEFADIRDRSLGFLLPNRRKHARDYYHEVGYILPFDPADYADRVALRDRLGYGSEPLIIGALGGTAIGRDLLELWAETYPILSEQLPGLHMRLVAGPRLDVETIRAPSGVEVLGYLPKLYEHLAASDLAIVEGGGTVTLELSALRRPFIYFPRESDCEQGIAVAGRLERHGAGVRMNYSTTTPAALAGVILDNLDTKPAYPAIPTNGARTAARLIAAQMLQPART